MGSRLRNPLLLALVAALIPAAGLAVWLGPVRALSSHHGTASATATPPPSASATPAPTPLPDLSVADRLALGSPAAFGRVEVHAMAGGPDSPLSMSVAGYSLATTPHGFPTSLPVWKVRGFASADTSGLAARLGLAVNATPPAGDSVDAAHGAARATTTRIPIAGNPSSGAQAIAAATEVLRSLGVMPRNSHAVATVSGDAPNREWLVGFLRNQLAGVQVGVDPAAEASLTVDEDGWVTSVDIEEEAVDGGAAYPLRDWHQAWADVTHHDWADMCCLGPNGNPGPDNIPGGSRYVLHVDSVYLYYEESDTDPDYLVPFYAFKDSRFGGIEISVPALRSADVSIVRSL